MHNKKNTKNFVLLLGLTAMMLLPTNLNAQNKPGGMFGYHHDSDANKGGMMRTGTSPSITGGGISNDDFNETPLGGGIAILIGTGLGYMALKNKEDKE